MSLSLSAYNYEIYSSYKDAIANSNFHIFKNIDFVFEDLGYKDFTSTLDFVNTLLVDVASISDNGHIFGLYNSETEKFVPALAIKTLMAHFDISLSTAFQIAIDEYPDIQKTKFTLLFEQFDSSFEMLEAIKKNMFYVDAVDTVTGYSIGSFDDIVPALFATEQEALCTKNDMIKEWDCQIKEGEREEDDIWESETLIAKWDGENEIELCDIEQNHISTENWVTLSGI